MAGGLAVGRQSQRPIRNAGGRTGQLESLAAMQLKVVRGNQGTSTVPS